GGLSLVVIFFFFFQAEDGIRDFHVTGVQTCALPIYPSGHCRRADRSGSLAPTHCEGKIGSAAVLVRADCAASGGSGADHDGRAEIGRASCRERAWSSVAAVSWRKKTKERRTVRKLAE